MGLYVYCILPAGSAPPGSLTGLAAAAVSAFECAGLCAWVSDLPDRPEPALERVKTHNAVVQHAIDNGVTPVPVRFGQWLSLPAQLEEHLRSRRDHYLALLALVAGTLEFGLRILDPERAPAPPHTVAPASGTAYLDSVRRQLRAHDLDDPITSEIKTVLHEVFQDVASAERFEPLRTAHGLISVAHLVRQPDFAAYHQRVQMIRHRFPHLRLLASGPWPPYSFA